MARLARVEIFSSDEIAIVHVMNRTVRRCVLMGNDPLTGKNFDHRKLWLEFDLKRLAAQFGIDLLCDAILSNHFHLVLRSRPDVVAQTLEQSDFTSVQRRIEAMQESLAEGATAEPEALDRDAGGSLESAVRHASTPQGNGETKPKEPRSRDAHLAPLTIDELRDALGAGCSTSGYRASDKGFLPLSVAAYVELLDWTARTIRSDKCGSTPVSAQPVFERLGISGEVWCALVRDFGRLFYAVAGQPQAIDACRSRRGQRRYKTKPQTRELLAASS